MLDIENLSIYFIYPLSKTHKPEFICPTAIGYSKDVSAQNVLRSIDNLSQRDVQIANEGQQH